LFCLECKKIESFAILHGSVSWDWDFTHTKLNFPYDLHLCLYFRSSERRLVTARRRCTVRAGTSKTWLINTLESGSLMPALLGGVTLTSMTSKAILSVTRIKDLMLYCTKRAMFRRFERKISCLSESLSPNFQAFNIAMTVYM